MVEKSKNFNLFKTCGSGQQAFTRHCPGYCVGGQPYKLEPCRVRDCYGWSSKLTTGVFLFKSNTLFKATATKAVMAVKRNMPENAEQSVEMAMVAVVDHTIILEVAEEAVFSFGTGVN